jgi:hypothetical protein
MTEERMSTANADDAVTPKARRIRQARWINPQLILGVLLILTCVAVGARVIASANDAVPVMVAANDIGAGQELTSELAQMRDVQLGAELDHYLTGEVGDGYVVTRDIGGGELIPRAAVVPADELAADIRYVALALPSAELPAGLASGSVVDIWVSKNTGGNAKRLASGVRVAELSGGSSGALGVDGAALTITLAMTESQGTDGQSLDELVGKLVGAGRDGRVYVSRSPVEGS